MTWRTLFGLRSFDGAEFKLLAPEPIERRVVAIDLAGQVMQCTPQIMPQAIMSQAMTPMTPQQTMPPQTMPPMPGLTQTQQMEMLSLEPAVVGTGTPSPMQAGRPTLAFLGRTRRSDADEDLKPGDADSNASDSTAPSSPAPGSPLALAETPQAVRLNQIPSTPTPTYYNLQQPLRFFPL